jgi:hypothetical protein
MDKAGISSKFEYSASFLRILIPGITSVALAAFIVILNYPDYISCLKGLIAESVWTLLPVGVTFLFASMFIGLMINVFITPLSRILEGYTLELHQKNYFIKALRRILRGRQWKKFVKYRKNYDSAEQGSLERGWAYMNIYNHFSHCLYNISNNPEIYDKELEKCILPTKLGNTFKSIETYPEWKCGMNSVFFWTRIQLLMSEESGKTIDKMRAFVDMFIELTWIFFFATIIYPLSMIYNGEYIFSVVSLGIFIVCSYVSYNMAVRSALEFGEYVRSIFDLYREELWNKIKNKKFNKLGSLPENERWDTIFRCLWLHKL